MRKKNVPALRVSCSQFGRHRDRYSIEWRAGARARSHSHIRCDEYMREIYVSNHSQKIDLNDINVKWSPNEFYVVMKKEKKNI